MLKITLFLIPLTVITAHSRGLRSSSSDLAALFNHTPKAPEICQTSFEEGGLVFSRNETMFVSPSFFQSCMESLPLNVENALDHIENLNGIFSQFHCFYHLASDPNNSNPINYQPELGRALFGEGEGQVDMAKRMGDLSSDVKSRQAANISTFWTINAVLQDLRDGHVQVPPVTGEAFVTWALRVFPERTLSGDTLTRPEFSLGDGEIGLKIFWQDVASGKETESSVESINGMSVSEFVKRLASSRSMQLTWQSLGARVNSFFKAANTGYKPHMFPLVFNTNPSDVLPDEFVVAYADGSEETFKTGVFSPGMAAALGVKDEDPTVYELKNRSAVEGFINRPGLAHQYYSEARGQIVDSATDAFEVSISKKAAPLNEKPTAKRTAKRISKRSFVLPVNESTFDFDHVWSRDGYILGQDGESVVPHREDLLGYKIEKDYAVLKVGTWLVDPVLFASEVWSNVTAAAQEKGVTKLVIDISGNGGGYGANAANLVVSMFPHVEYKWFSDNLDQTYNDPMADYVNIVTPLIREFENITESWEDDMLAFQINGLSDDQVEALSVTSQSLLKFCALNTKTFCVGPTCETSCRQLEELATEVENFLRYPTPPAYLDVWNSILTVARELSAWTTTLGGTIAQLMGEQKTVEPAMRGGANYNLTARGSLLWYQSYNEAARIALQAGHTFDEYIIVSDGTAASASSIFSSLVEQIWKNREQSGAKSRVTTVAYGGTGTQSDLTMAAIPAAVENVHIDNSFYTTFSLLMMPMLIAAGPEGGNTELVERLIGTVDALDERTFHPSYFAQRLPQMPVQNYYDRFMDPGALPLQYVKMQPDKYIPKIFTETSFEEDKELSSLYALASGFFDDSLDFGEQDFGDLVISVENGDLVVSMEKSAKNKVGDTQVEAEDMVGSADVNADSEDTTSGGLLSSVGLPLMAVSFLLAIQ